LLFFKGMTRNPDRTSGGVDEVIIELQVAVEPTRPGQLAQETAVSSIMTPRVVCVTENLGVDTLTILLDEKGFGGVPVVDRHGGLIGMVSKTDIVRMARENDETQAVSAIDLHQRQHDEPGCHDLEAETRTVADIMMPLAFSIPEGASIGQASAMLATEGVHRLPVTDVDGKIVGIVSTTDVVRWLAVAAGCLPPATAMQQ
jgi:CBS-domain-containing membrane protein